MAGARDYERDAADARRALKGLHHAGGMLGGDARAAVVDMQAKLAEGAEPPPSDAREATLEAGARRWLVRGLWTVAALAALVVLLTQI